MSAESYPDLTEIFARKERGRRMLAELSFAEKLQILDRMRENEIALGGILRREAARALELEKP